MKKLLLESKLKTLQLLLLLPLFLLTGIATAQTIVTVGGGASVTCPATPTATWTTPPAGVTFSNWSRGSGVSCGTASTALSGSGFNTASAAASFAANKYYSVTLTAAATHNFTLNSLTWATAVSSGTATFTVQYSNNGGAVTTFGTAGTNTSSNTFNGTVNVAAGTSLVLYLIPSNTGAAGTTVRWVNGSTITVTASSAISTPTTTSISPSSATAGSGGFTITVDGTNFVSGSSTVTWNGSSRSTTFVNATQLTASILGTDITSPGTANVGVTTTGAPASSNTQTFTINTPPTPLLGISGTPTNHGSVCPTTSAATVQYTITNTGSVQADGLNVVSDDPQFVVSGLSNTSVAASGGTVTYNVTFTPSSAGAKSATITVTSSTSGSNSPTSGLTGTGTTPVAQTVSSASAGSVSNTTATLNGNVTALGICPSTTQKGFVYAETATNADPLNGGTGVTTTPVAGLATGAYNLPLSSLNTGTGYSFKAYVYDGTTYTYGAVTTFTTLLPANHLAFVGVPSSGTVNANLSAFTVEARRPDNSVDATYTGNVTISKASGPGTLSGTLTVAAVAGVATFSAAQFNTAGTVTLSAASGSLSNATSGNITILLAPVALYREDFGTSTTVNLPYNYGTNATGSGLLNANLTTPSWNQNAASGNFGGSSGGSMSSTVTTSINIVNTFSVNTGNKLTPSSIAYNYRISASGPTTLNVTVSGTGGSASIAQVTTTRSGAFVGVVTSNFLSSVDLTGPITLTFAFTGSGGGTLRLDDVTLNGNITCIDPTIYNVTGGGTVCSAGPGTAIGLSGSQSGMNYQLKIGAGNSGSPVAGTGSALNFGNYTTAGTYTVEAINSNGSCNVTLAMNGNAVVAADTAPVGGTLGGGTTVCAGSNSGTLTLTGHSGNIIKWQSSTVSDFSSNVTDIAVTIDTYNFTNVNVPTYFRVELGNGICPVAYSSTAFVDVQQNFWTGTVDTDWNTAGNWNCGSVPGFATDVTIPAAANQPIIANNVTVNSLTLEANTSLTVQTGYNLTVTNALSVNATANMNLEVNANLIQSADVNNTGSITVDRTSGALMRLDYTLWSSPVAGQNLEDFSPATSANRFYIYNPATDLYNAVDASVTDFAEGTGYLIRMPNNHPTTPTVWNGQFAGVPNNGNVDLTVANNTYNAVGNPYPSTIDADLFISGNSLTEALYFWRKTNAAATTAYATYTLAGGAGTNPSPGDPNNGVPNGIIQIGQGFIARSTGTTLSFNNAMRIVDNNGQFFRTSQIERNRIWVNLTNAEGVFSQTMVSYMTGATQGIDAAIDGLYFNDSQIALTSLIGTSEYAVQGRALPFDSADVVPMGFKVLAAGTYTIALDHADGLFEDGSQAVILKDLLTGTEQNLREGSYTFTSDAGVFNSRFEIVYQTTLATNNPVWNASQVVVYSQNKQLVINSGNTEMSKVEVFDIRGRLLAGQSNINASETRMNIAAANQVLIVRITSADNKLVTKKVVN